MQSMGERERAASVPVSDGITKADLSSCLKKTLLFPLYRATLASSWHTLHLMAFLTYFPGVYIRKS